MKTMDLDAVGALLELDHDTGGTLVTDMISSYRSEFPKRLARMNGFFAARDAKALAFEAHATKSSFANFGSLVTAAIFQQVELAAKADNWKEIETVFPEIPAAVAQFEKDLLELEKRAASYGKNQAS